MLGSTIKINNITVIKTYEEANIVSKHSSMANELVCLGKFKSKHTVNILSTTENSYTTPHYGFNLGDPYRVSAPNISRMLFSISIHELFQQLDEIVSDLKASGINHRDIHPGNLIFSEKDRLIRLIDFYWAKTDGITVGDPRGGVNGYYSNNDKTSIEIIKTQIMKVSDVFVSKVLKIKTLIACTLGKKYHDGSSTCAGRTYHKLDIPQFDFIKPLKNTKSEYKDILSNIDKPVDSVIDIGCAAGYSVFNLMRQLGLRTAYVYEADPDMFNILTSLISTYNLHELVLNTAVIPVTLFPKAHLGLCMNVHMWLHKQYGQADTDLIMKNLFIAADVVFFQTSGKESLGMYRVLDLDSSTSIIAYLSSLTSKPITHISSTKNHGGLRHLFKIGT